MSFVGRLFARDLAEISRSRGPLALVFVLPVVLLMLIGNLNVRAPVIRVAVVADATQAGQPQLARLTQLESVLQEIASLHVVRWPSSEASLRERSVQERIDLVIVSDGDDWRFHTPLTSKYRAQFAQAVTQDVALSLQRYAQRDEQLERLEGLARELGAANVVLAPPAEAASAGASPASQSALAPRRGSYDKAIRTVEELSQTAKQDASIPTPILRAWLANRLNFYFPAASRADHSLVPGFIALIAVFLPFLLASGALVRERESGTLQTVIIAARRNWVWVAAGKLLMPIFVSILATLLLLVAARSAFGFGIKAGMLQALGLQLLATTVSGLFGLSISTLITSAQDAYTTASAYLVACILITGLIYPVDQAASAVTAISYLFPLTLSGPALEEWMLKGASASLEPWRWGGLLAQLGAGLALCAVALQRLRTSL